MVFGHFGPFWVFFWVKIVVPLFRNLWGPLKIDFPYQQHVTYKVSSDISSWNMTFLCFLMVLGHFGPFWAIFGSYEGSPSFGTSGDPSKLVSQVNRISHTKFQVVYSVRMWNFYVFLWFWVILGHFWVILRVPLLWNLWGPFKIGENWWTLVKITLRKKNFQGFYGFGPFWVVFGPY